jgi:hypothetical protein
VSPVVFFALAARLLARLARLARFLAGDLSDELEDSPDESSDEEDESSEDDDVLSDDVDDSSDDEAGFFFLASISFDQKLQKSPNSPLIPFYSIKRKNTIKCEKERIYCLYIYSRVGRFLAKI